MLAPSTDHEILTAEEERAYVESRLAPIIYQVYDGPNVFTAKDIRAYKYAHHLKKTKYFYPTYACAIGPEAAPTLDGSEPPTPKPLTRVPRQHPPQTPRMGRLEKKAAKIARNTPKTGSISPTPLPQVVETEQAPTTGIPPVPVPLEPTILPQVVETEQAPTTGIPPVPVPLEPTILPQDIETAGVPTPEPTISG